MTGWEISPFEPDGLRVAPLRPPMLPEPARHGEDPSDCNACRNRDDGIWFNDRWRLVRIPGSACRWCSRCIRVITTTRRISPLRGRRNEAITAEHLLLAVLAVRHGLAARTVANLTGSYPELENAVVAVLPVGQRPSPAHIPLPQPLKRWWPGPPSRHSSGGKIGTEHLLLGLLVTTDNAAVRQTGAFGIDYGATYAEIEWLRAE